MLEEVGVISIVRTTMQRTILSSQGCDVKEESTKTIWWLTTGKGKGKKQIMKMNQCPVNVKMLMQTTTNSMSLTIPRFYLIPILRRTTWMGKKAYFFIANNGNLVSYASATNCGALGKTGPQHSLSPDSLPISFFVCSSQYIGGPSGQHIQTQWLI